MPDLMTLLRIMICVAPVALFALLISVKLRASRSLRDGTTAPTRPSLVLRLLNGMCLGISMVGGGIGGIFVGFGLVTTLGFGPADDLFEQPVAAGALFGSILAGFMAPWLLYARFFSRYGASTERDTDETHPWYHSANEEPRR